MSGVPLRPESAPKPLDEDDRTTDLLRECQKAHDVLVVVSEHLNHLAASNAALHLASDKVIPSPLAAKVDSVLAGLRLAIGRHDG